MLTEKDYCDYDTCVALKELGYVGSSRYYYTQRDHKFHYDVYNKFYTVRTADAMGYVLAIHLYEAQKWLREEKGLHIEVFFSLMDDKRQLHYDWHIVHNIRFDNDEYTYNCDVLDSMRSYKSYEEALSEGVREAIKILKEN